MEYDMLCWTRDYLVVEFTHGDYDEEDTASRAAVIIDLNAQIVEDDLFLIQDGYN